MLVMDVTEEEADLIREHRQAARQRKAAQWKPRPKNEISVEEKVAAFDALYNQSHAFFTQLMNGEVAGDCAMDWESDIYESTVTRTISEKALELMEEFQSQM